jgi:DnaK suppressor protein
MTTDDEARSTVVPDPPHEMPDLAKIIRTFTVREGEKPWTVKEVRAVADDLMAEIARLQVELSEADAELSALLRNSGDGAGDDQADSGSSALEREQELTLVNNTRDLLDQNRHALERVGAPGFGACEACGEPIGKARQERR